MDIDLDDNHLCIKCRETIVGLENYIEHRKQNCIIATTTTSNPAKVIPSNSTPPQEHCTEVTPALNYETFQFNEPEPPSSTSQGGKTSKSMAESYDLPYELDADVFFSFLQLQSVQSSVHSTSGGKTGSAQQALQRQKSLQQDSDNSTHAYHLWKAVRDMGETKKSYETGFKNITFEDDTDDEDEVNINDDDDEDYDPIADGYGSRGKWKLPSMRNSPPVVPLSHTGGKWKPESRPKLRVTHTELSRLSPNWEDDMDAREGQHPPSDHTKGKWIPGTKLQRLEYKEVAELAKCNNTNQDYWCKICCRKLKSKSIYENHLKSSYHLKRAEPEQQLEKAAIKEISRDDINKTFSLALYKPQSETLSCNSKTTPSTKDKSKDVKNKTFSLKKRRSTKVKSKDNKNITFSLDEFKSRSEALSCDSQKKKKRCTKVKSKNYINKTFSLAEYKTRSETLSRNSKKRKRRCTYFKCSLCKHVMIRHLIGKHLISHYHYRRMQPHLSLSLHMILDNIHAIVLQSPFQCRPCRFYANTEETFLLHWNSASHLDYSEGPGRFCCSYCQFECEDNNQMRRHLLGPEHKEVILAINRSVPISISKRINIECTKCGLGFRYNFELRRHFLNHHQDMEFTGSASDSYQSKFKCLLCPEILLSQISLQRHEKFKHSVYTYFCSICSLEFKSPCEARRHRKTLDHKHKSLAAIAKSQTNEKEEKKTNTNLHHKQRLAKLEVSHSKVNTSITLDELPCTSKEAKSRLEQQKSSASKKPLNCENCQLKFSSREHLKLHRKSEHKNSQHICMSCAQTFLTAQELGKHSRSCKPTNITKTEEIEISKPTKSETNEKGETIWKCHLCEFRAPFESEILYHRVFHSYGCVDKNQLIKCPLCEKSFRKQSLRFHLRQHTNEKIFKCEICYASFSRPYNLKDHIKKVHLEKSIKLEKIVAKAEDGNKIVKEDTGTYKCDSCDKVFKSKNSLKIHSLTHHDATNAENHQRYACTHENCEYATVSKSLLKIHLISHSMESYKCDEKNCNYVGKSKLHLKRHLLSHVPETKSKQFPCDKCKFKTKIKGHLQRHMRQHTGEKPYPCPHCDFRCSSLENLRKHVLKTGKHPGKFVYECKLCVKELGKNNGAAKNIKEVFKTNSHQGYQQHLNKLHKKQD